MSDPSQRNTEFEPPAPTINGTNLPPGFWANNAQKPTTALVQFPRWNKVEAAIKKVGTLMNSMRHLPLLREPTVKYREKRCWSRWPWTGTDFSACVTRKKSNYEGLLAQATGELLDGEDACYHCQQGMGMFDGCVRVPGRENCANCHMGGYRMRCSLGSGDRSITTVQDGAAPGGSTSNTEQLLEKARKEQADLQHIVDQTQHILEHTQRMLDHKTKEVNALDCAVKEAQVT